MCFQNGFLVLCVVRCGVWSVLLILFFALGLCVEFVDALGFGLCFGFWRSCFVLLVIWVSAWLIWGVLSEWVENHRGEYSI